MTKVTIIGSGIAAIAAALEASSSGAEVTLVRGHPGATALSSGAWDIAAPPNRFPNLPWHEYPTAEESLTDLIRRNPRHPYSLLAQNEKIPSLGAFLEQSMNRLSNGLSLRLRGGVGKKMLLLNPLGGIKTTGFAHLNHAAGNLLEMRGAKLLIIGFRGLVQFSAPQIGNLLGEMNLRQGTPWLSEIKTAEISLKGLPPPLSPIDLARRLDDETILESLHQALLQEVERGGGTHVALPPVIGLKKTDHILGRLTETTRTVWFETIGTPPSIPGIRLQNAIDRFLETAHPPAWRIIDGEAVGGEIKHRRIQELRVRIKDKEEALPVDRLILATGRYIGGGIIKEKRFREPVLDLPLFADGTRVDEIFTGRLVSEKFLDDHPLFSVGVRTNKHLQPVGEGGAILYENLWVAGSLIGGYNSAVQQCGMGVAVGTGTLAGRGL